MFSAETLMELRKNQYGWVTPDDKIIPCGLYEHVAVAKEHVSADIKAKIESLLTAMDAELAAVDKEWAEDAVDDSSTDHVDWHVYEFSTDNIKTEYNQKIYDILYSEGWGRLGIAGTNIYIEGSYKFRKILTKHIKEISQMLNMSYHVETKYIDISSLTV